MNSASGVLELSRIASTPITCQEASCFAARLARDDDAPRPATEMYEFEVIAEKCRLQEGERFYLTPSQAKRAYFANRRMS